MATSYWKMLPVGALPAAAPLSALHLRGQASPHKMARSRIPSICVGLVTEGRLPAETTVDDQRGAHRPRARAGFVPDRRLTSGTTAGHRGAHLARDRAPVLALRVALPVGGDAPRRLRPALYPHPQHRAAQHLGATGRWLPLAAASAVRPAGLGTRRRVRRGPTFWGAPGSDSGHATTVDTSAHLRNSGESSQCRDRRLVHLLLFVLPRAWRFPASSLLEFTCNLVVLFHAHEANGWRAQLVVEQLLRGPSVGQTQQNWPVWPIVRPMLAEFGQTLADDHICKHGFSPNRRLRMFGSKLAIAWPSLRTGPIRPTLVDFGPSLSSLRA